MSGAIFSVEWCGGLPILKQPRSFPRAETSFGQSIGSLECFAETSKLPDASSREVERRPTAQPGNGLPTSREAQARVAILAIRPLI